jgi:hypothetical protein
MTLQTRAAELIAAGYYVAPAHGYALLTPGVDPRKTPYTAEEAARGPDLNICLGEMRTGRYAYKLDLDTHKEDQNADAARAGLKDARPELEAKIDWHRSRGEKGWHGHFISTRRLDTGKLYDLAENHIGELLGADTDRTLDPGTLNPPTLHSGEIERLFNVWHVQTSSLKGERWADRAKQGERWTRGSQQIPATRADLRRFLQNDAGAVGKQLDAYFDRPPHNRSDEAGNLMQNLMFFARKLPGCINAPFTVRCANVKAYWMAADSFGKAGEKGYNQDKDADSLIAQIVNEDPFGPKEDGRHWKCPSWVPGNTATSAPAAPPVPEAPRPAHRPAGDRAKQIARFKRLLKHRWEDETTGRFYYFVDDLDDWAARCGVSRRSIQSYLTEIEAGEQIERGQEGGRGGRPWMLIKPAFFGMQVTPETAPKAVPEPDKIDALWHADPAADSGILTPRSAESTPVCKVDHQNTCAPATSPSALPTVEDLVTRELAALQGLYRDLRPRPPDQRAAQRPHRQQRFIPRREQQLVKQFARQEQHGIAPAPAAYRPRAAPLPLESLPEPPQATAPAGAQGAGAPLPVPAGVAGIVERLHLLRAQREDTRHACT